jgi:NAD-dependent SIR2 family protein deacetylase
LVWREVPALEEAAETAVIYVIGTSLQVYPAGWINRFHKPKILLSISKPIKNYLKLTLNSRSRSEGMNF